MFCVQVTLYCLAQLYYYYQSFIIMKRLIAFSCIIILFFLPRHVSAQSRTVAGTVVSGTNGQALESVTISNGINSVASDQKGRFLIPAGKKNILSFSYVGYASRQISIDTLSADPVIILNASDNALDAVVVTALGVSRQKKSLGYAVQEVKGSSLSEARESNIVNALAGKVAGVRVTTGRYGFVEDRDPWRNIYCGQ